MYLEKVEASRIKDKVYFGNDDLINNEMEIRKLLGNRFHLHTEITTSGIGYKRKWSLYRKYPDTKVYLSEDNKLIMNSDDHNEADLLDFAKRHHIKNIYRAIYKTSLIASILLMILCITNFLLYRFNIIGQDLHNFLSGINIGSIVLVLIYNFISVRIEIYNNDIELEELKQYLLSDNLE